MLLTQFHFAVDLAHHFYGASRRSGSIEQAETQQALKKRAASAFDAEDSENSFLADPDEPQVFQKVQDLGTRSKRTKKPKLVETTNTGPVTKLVEAINVGPVTKRGRGRPKKVMLQ